MKKLYIFATSSRPDVYINAIAYSIEHMNVGAIYVIVISEHDYPEEEQKVQLMATDVLVNIILQLQALQQGNYIIFGRLATKIPQFLLIILMAVLSTQNVLMSSIKVAVQA